MWTYEKKLQYPVNIKTPNPRLAKFIISQLGGPDGELAASLRYMHQRYGMKNNQVKGILTDIATEELAHVEMVSAILYQLTRDMTPEQILQDGYAEYFVDHTAGIYPQGASGMPFTAAYFQSKGDPITDLTEDLAAEQKHAAPMKIFYVCVMTQTFESRLNFSGSGKSCISSGLERQCEWYRMN